MESLRNTPPPLHGFLTEVEGGCVSKGFWPPLAVQIDDDRPSISAPFVWVLKFFACGAVPPLENVFLIIKVQNFRACGAFFLDQDLNQLRCNHNNSDYPKFLAERLKGGSKLKGGGSKLKGLH